MFKRPSLKLEIPPTSRSILAIGTLFFLLLIYTWHLGNFAAGLSQAESTNLAASHSLHALYHQPLNLPHNFLQWVLTKLHRRSLLDLRLVSAAWGVLFMACFYKICKSWFGNFAGWLTTLLLATTPLVALAARSASSDIMFLVPLLPWTIYFWITRSKSPPSWALAALSAAAAISIYTPGMFWLFVVGLAVIRGNFKNLAQNSRRMIGMSIFIFLALLAPLVAGLFRSPHLIWAWLSLPQHWHILSMLKNIGWMGTGLVWRSASHHDLQIGRLAVINAAQVILLIIGAHALWRKATTKAYGLALVVILLLILAGISDVYMLVLAAVPILAIGMAAGLRYLHIEWQGVFPRNPIPKAFALAIICLAVGFSVFYNVRYSLVAWPHTVATRQAYMIK